MNAIRILFGDRPRIFFICLFVWTLSNMDQALFGYAVPGILAEFDLSLEAVGIVLTISFAAAAVMTVAAGVAADRWGRGVALSVLLAASAVSVGLQGFAGGIVALTLFRALGFGFSAGLSPITNTLVVDQTPARYRGVAMGLLQCGYPLGWFLAALAAAPLLDRYGWRAVCFIAFAVVPVMLPVAWLLRSTAPAAPPAASAVAPESALALLLEPGTRRVAIASAAIFFLFGAAYAGSAFFFPAYFTQSRGYSPADAASLVGLSNGIAVFGYVGAAVVGEFVLTRRTVFVAWCLGGAVALLGLLWLSDGRTQDLLWYGLTAAFFFGSQAVSAVFIAELFPARIRASALAICASAPLSLGFAVFPLIVPAVVGLVGWPGGLSLVVVPLLTAAGLIAFLLPNRVSGLAAA